MWTVTVSAFDASKLLEAAQKAHNYNYVDRVTVSAFDASKLLEAAQKAHNYNYVDSYG